MRKWTDEEIDRVKRSPGFFWDAEFYTQTADHIRELQEAVEDYREYLSGLDDDLDIFESYFWPADDAETREDPDDNWPGHEWS